MKDDHFGGYISNITFNNGQHIDVAPNDIIIFVGPNNAGKSQSLKDIYQLSSEKLPTVVVSDIKITKYSAPVSNILSKIAPGQNHGSYISYSVLGRNINIWGSNNEKFMSEQYLGDFRNVFIANLDTSARLTICNPPQSINRNTAKQHPIHYAAYDRKYRKWLSDNFQKAFHNALTPNTQYGATIPLCIGDPVLLSGEYEDEQSRMESYAEILDNYKQVQDQGDGVKSFTGILLYLMLDHFNTYLIDEPESFLHPPQARIMGQIIGETLNEHQQALISTHSEEIIKGLLEVCPKRIKIVRITRDKDTNHFAILNNQDFDKVWNDPLLRYSNIMASLFHKTVVLCESDSDCKMYSIIENHIKQKTQRYSETLFIHCGGKHRMSKIITALRALNIDVKLIADIDVLNDENVFKGITTAFDIGYSSIQADYNNIVSNLHSSKERVNRSIAKASIEQVLERSTNTDLSAKELKEIKEIISTISKWDGIKKAGAAALPPGKATTSYNKIDQILREHSIFIVPVGELECFVKEVGGHGPEWVNAVFEKYPNLDDNVYRTITEFITSMKL